MKTAGCSRCRAISKRIARRIERAGARALEVRTADGLGRMRRPDYPRRREHHHAEAARTSRISLEPLRAVRRAANRFTGPAPARFLLAQEVTHPAQASLDLMDIAVERNGYGRQIDSRIAEIRAERRRRRSRRCSSARRSSAQSGEGATVIASYNGDPVWVEQGRHMVTTFHPELTDDPRVHRRFVEKL